MRAVHTCRPRCRVRVGAVWRAAAQHWLRQKVARREPIFGWDAENPDNTSAARLAHKASLKEKPQKKKK